MQHPDHHCQSQVLDERERMGRIDIDRRQDREQARQKFGVKPSTLRRLQILRIDEMDPSFRELTAHRDPASLLVGDETASKLIDALDLLGGCQAVRAQGRYAGRHLAVKASRAHHVKFIEIGGGDRQKAQPLQ